jgi:hypothetical protein
MCRADSGIALDHAQRLPAAFLADGLEIDSGHDATARPMVTPVMDVKIRNTGTLLRVLS